MWEEEVLQLDEMYSGIAKCMQSNDLPGQVNIYRKLAQFFLDHDHNALARPVFETGLTILRQYGSPIEIAEWSFELANVISQHVDDDDSVLLSVMLQEIISIMEAGKVDELAPSISLSDLKEVADEMKVLFSDPDRDPNEPMVRDLKKTLNRKVELWEAQEALRRSMQEIQAEIAASSDTGRSPIINDPWGLRAAVAVANPKSDIELISADLPQGEALKPEHNETHDGPLKDIQ